MLQRNGRQEEHVKERIVKAVALMGYEGLEKRDSAMIGREGYGILTR